MSFESSKWEKLFEEKQKVIITKVAVGGLSHLKILKEYSNRELIGNRAVQGIIVTGSVAKGFADEFSDVDFIVVFSGDGKNIQEGKFWETGLTFDLRKIDIELLRKLDWTLDMKEAYKGGKVIFDRTGEIHNLISNKTIFLPNEKIYLLNRCLIRLACTSRTVDVWRGFKFGSELYKKVKRGDIFSAHYYLSRVVDSLISAIFLLNDKIPPEDKRGIEYVFDLKWNPKKLDVSLKRLVMIREFSVKELMERLSVFDELFLQIMDKVDKRKGVPKSIYKYYLNNRGP